MKMKEVLYIPCLKKNLISISALDKKGYRHGCFFRWTSNYVAKGKTLEDVVVIREEEG